MKKAFNCVVGLSTFLFLSSTFAYANDTKDERVAQFMKAIVSQDIIFDLTSLQTTNNAFFSLPDEPKLNYSVSSMEITHDFNSNRTQAEQKYGNAVFDVFGPIVGVKKDADGKSYVVYKTSKDANQNTIALLTPKGAEKAESYLEGQMLKLRCSGASQTTVVTLTSCQEMPPVEEEATKVADKAVNMFLNGEDIERVLVTNGDKPASQTLFFLYYIGSHFELNDKCFSRETIRQCDFTKYHVNLISRSEEYKKAYEKGKAFYHLP